MSEADTSSEQRVMHALAARERGFVDLWRRVEGDGERAALFRALDPLGIEGEPVISVQFDRASVREWLQIQLGTAAPHGIEWVTYHCADIAGHAERLITETRTPALWQAATYYADLAAHLLLTARQQREQS
jgi:hypothetical protein